MKLSAPKILIIVFVVLLIICSFAIYLLNLQSPNVPKTPIKNKETTQSVFGNINKTKEPTNLDYSVYTNTAMRLLGLLSLPDFTDTPESWKNILEDNQFYITTSCNDTAFTMCTINYAASNTEVYSDKNFTDVNLTKFCKVYNTEYIEGDTTYSVTDKKTLTDFVGKSIDLIGSYQNGYDFKEGLVNPDWCVFRIK